MRWFDVSKNDIKLHKKSQTLLKKTVKTCWTPDWLRAINHELSQVKTFACMRGGWRNPRRFWNENTVQFVSSPTSINRHHVHCFHGKSLNSMGMDTEYLNTSWNNESFSLGHTSNALLVLCEVRCRQYRCRWCRWRFHGLLIATGCAIVGPTSLVQIFKCFL